MFLFGSITRISCIDITYQAKSVNETSLENHYVNLYYGYIFQVYVSQIKLS